MLFRSTTFQEVSEESPEEQYVMDSARLVRTFDVVNPPSGQRTPVSLSVRRQAVEDFLGAQVRAGSTGQRYLTRLTPYKTPAPVTAWMLSRGGANLVQPFIATAIPTSQLLHVKTNNAAFSLPGQGGQGGAASGPFWRVKVFFDSVPWAVKEDSEVLAKEPAPVGGQQSPLAPAFPDEGDRLRDGIENTRYIVRYLEFGGRFVTLSDFHQGTGVAPVLYTVDAIDGAGAAGCRPIDIGVPFPESSCVVHYVWKMVPANARPLQAIQKLLSGCVNECPFDGWLTGTLLFQSVKEKLYQGPLGDTLYDMDYAFKFLPHQKRFDTNGNPTASGDFLGWNAILHRRTNLTIDYARMDSKNDGTTNNPPYRFSDFASLFRPDQTGP